MPVVFAPGFLVFLNVELKKIFNRSSYSSALDEPFQRHLLNNVSIYQEKKYVFFLISFQINNHVLTIKKHP